MRTISGVIFTVMLLSIGNCFAQPAIVPPPSDHSQPITLTIANNSPYDLEISNINTTNISPEDQQRLEASPFYSHTEYTFTFRRTGYPVNIFLVFRVALTERDSRGYSVAQWEYAEDQNRAAVCHIADAVEPFLIGCSGDNNIKVPSVDLSISYVPPSQDVPAYPLPSP